MVSFDSTSKNTTVQFKGDTTVCRVPATYLVNRSKRPLTIKVNTNNRDTIYYVRSTMDKMFWLNLISPAGYYGMIADAFSPKSMSYPSQILITDSCLQTRQYSNLGLKQLWGGAKGDMRIQFGFPLFTQRSHYTPRGDVNPFGIFGFELGGEYFFRRGQSVSLNAGVAPDFPDLFCYYGCANSRMTYIRAETHWEMGRWYIGAGAQQGRHDYTAFKSVEDSLGWFTLVETYHFRSRMLGASLSADYRLSHVFFLGVDYMPSFFEIHNGFNFRFQQTWLLLHFKARIFVNSKWQFRKPILQVVGNTN